MEKVDKLFSSSKQLHRIRENYLKLGEVHQKQEQANLESATVRFQEAIKAFLDSLKITGVDYTVFDEKAEEAVTDCVERKMAGIITKKFKVVIENEIKKLHSTIEAEVLELMKQDAFVKKIKEATDVSLEECLANRPDSFKPETDPKLKEKKEKSNKKDKK